MKVVFLLAVVTAISWYFYAHHAVIESENSIAAYLNDRGDIVVPSKPDGIRDFLCHISHFLGDFEKKPDYCTEVFLEVVSLEDAIKALEEPYAVYCPGFDFMSVACLKKQQAVKDAISACFTHSYFDKWLCQTGSI